MENAADTRRFPRLEIALPVFVRGEDVQGKHFTELALTMNISFGGALLVLHKDISPQSKVTLEMPRPPVFVAELPALGLSGVEARTVRAEPRSTYQIVAVQFLTPLQAPDRTDTSGRRSR